MGKTAPAEIKRKFLTASFLKNRGLSSTSLSAKTSRDLKDVPEGAFGKRLAYACSSDQTDYISTANTPKIPFVSAEAADYQSGVGIGSCIKPTIKGQFPRKRR